MTVGLVIVVGREGFGGAGRIARHGDAGLPKE